MAFPITPYKVKFEETVMDSLERYVEDNILALKDGLSDLHENKVKKWRDWYRGIPRDAVRNFPWPNASNVCIQIIGECCDILRARTLGTIYETMPLWTTGLIGDWGPEEFGEEQRNSVEEWMNLIGLEPNELDLYRVESCAFDEAIKFGTVVVKFPYELLLEVEAVGELDGTTRFSEFTKYRGPRPEKLEFTKWAATPSANTLDTAKFKYHERTLTKQELLERAHSGVYDKAIVDSLLLKPDREGPSNKEQQKQEQTGAKETPQGTNSAEWDVYECWFPYFHNGHTYRIIYTYHLGQKKTLRAIFNFYGKNEEPWELGRLGYTDDGIYGFGFCEMLNHYQEEISTTHNQRIDNRTLANTSVLFAGSNYKLDAGFGIYPAAVLPFKPDDVELKQMGTVDPSSVEEEAMSIQLAKARAGVETGLEAAGGGSVGKKGQYGAGSTFSVLQSGNRRSNINITDMRYLHLRIGRKVLSQYATFGIGDKGKCLGKNEEYLKLALENLKKGRINLPIRAATASINRELEKQNDMLLSQTLQRHHSGIAQILQGLTNPSIPKELHEFLIGWIGSAGQLMSHILRNFGHDDISRLLPELDLIKRLRGADNGQQSMGGTTSQNEAVAGNQSPVRRNNQTQAADISLASTTGGGDISGLR